MSVESTPSPSFAGVDGIVRVEQAETESLDAVYFDTPARDLGVASDHVAPPHRRW